MANETQAVMPKAYLDKIYKRYYQGALVRTGGSAIMWCVALVSYLSDVIKKQDFLSVTAVILYLVLINPLILFILRRIQTRTILKLFSLLAHMFEIIGYTSIIYCLGGIEAAYLVPLYAILISYLGILTSRDMPYFVAGLCSICFALMVLADYYGVIPHLTILSEPNFLPLKNQLSILLVTVALLFILAYTSSYTAGLLRKSKEILLKQNEELIVAWASAKDANKAKSEFLANMSHELRTPLNHIIGFTELVVDKKAGNLNEKQNEFLNDVLLSGRHLLSLISDILDLSKVEAGKLKLELSRVNLRRLLGDSFSMIKVKASESGIHLTTTLDGIPNEVMADERKIKQILYNLLSNAAKFTPNGGEIELLSTYMSGDPDQGDSDHVLITVRDTGVGIKREDLEKIFNPFESSDSTRARRYQGAGLGLSITKSLVELHGGKVWAESEGEGKGSCFRFTLPLQHTD